jgi:hypothetical protein
MTPAVFASRRAKSRGTVKIKHGGIPQSQLRRPAQLALPVLKLEEHSPNGTIPAWSIARLAKDAHWIPPTSVTSDDSDQTETTRPSIPTSSVNAATRAIKARHLGTTEFREVASTYGKNLGRRHYE